MAQDATTHTIGEKFGGGVVFFLTPNGQHGLIAEIQDQLQKISFFPRPSKEYMEMSGNPKYLSEDAKNYTDWRLPSFFELSQMYSNKDIIGGFTDNLYLSSSGFSQGNALISFKDGSQKTNSLSNINLRLIRSF
jgi:hypothetical protein